MGDVRLADRLYALAMLAAGIAALVYAEPGDRLSHHFSSTPETHFLPRPILGAILVTAGFACLFAAWRLWNGRWPGRDRLEAAPGLFGRNAEMRPSHGSLIRRLALAFPLVAVATVALDRLGPSPTPGGMDAGRQVPPVEAPIVPATPGSGLSTTPPALVNPSPAPPAQAVEPPAQPPAEVAAAPVAPPETVAPAPRSPARPSQADGHHDAVVWLAVAPDGKSLMSASTDRTIKLWDLAGKHLVRDLGLHKDMARTALFLPGGDRALTAGDDGEIVLRAVADGAVLHVFSAGENGGANKLAITPDGRRAVSGHDTGNVIVWNLEAGKALYVLTGHDWSISAVAVSPDGRHALTSSIDGELRLWDIDEGRLLRRWQAHERGAYGAVFTADGHHAVTGSGDRTIKLWDLDTFSEIRRFEGHSGTVYALALSADGKRLLSGSLDGTARLWDMESGDQLAIFDPDTGPIYAVAFAADGSVLTGGGDRSIRRWSADGDGGEILFPGAPE